MSCIGGLNINRYGGANKKFTALTGAKSPPPPQAKPLHFTPQLKMGIFHSRGKNIVLKCSFINNKKETFSTSFLVLNQVFACFYTQIQLCFASVEPGQIGLG